MSRPQRAFVCAAPGDVLEAHGQIGVGEAPATDPPHQQSDGAAFRADVCADLELALQRLRRNLGLNKALVKVSTDAGVGAPLAAVQRHCDHPLQQQTLLVARAAASGELDAAVAGLQDRLAALERRVGTEAIGDGGAFAAIRDLKGRVALLEPGAAEELALRVDRTLELQRQWRTRDAATFGADKCAPVLQLLNALDQFEPQLQQIGRLAAHHRSVYPLHQLALGRFAAFQALVEDAEGVSCATAFADEQLQELRAAVNNNSAALQAALESFSARLSALQQPS